jgi:hypothetical protein
MATAAKTYIVEDAEEHSDPKAAHTPFPGTPAGLLGALAPHGTALLPGRQRCGHSRGEAADDHPQVR